MDRFEKLDRLLADQVGIASQLQEEIALLKQEELFSENERLRQKVAELEAIRERLSSQARETAEENRRLKNELYEQLFNEKVQLADRTDKRVEAYFSSAVGGEHNQMNAFEQFFRNRITELTRQLTHNRVEMQNPIHAKLQALQTEAAAQIQEARRQSYELERQVWMAKEEEMQRLKAEPLTDEAIARRGKQNNMEALFGLKLFNVLGIILIIIGVIAAARFTYQYIPDLFKTVLMYALGLGFLVFGEFLNRKKPNVFSLGMTSCGVAVLYIATALSFFYLETLSMFPALGLCVLATVLAFFLSRRYNSQTIATFALIGGYLPLFSMDEALILFGVGYLILLHIFALSVACIRKWRITQYVGFGLSMITIFYISALFYEDDFHMAAFIAMMYAFFSFVVYTLIPLLSSYRNKEKLKPADTVLLSLNTLFGSVALFIIFGVFEMWDAAKWLAVCLATYHGLFAILIKLKMESEKGCRVLFFITGIAFGAIAVPLWLDVGYFSLGWLVEGVLLLCYGLLRGKKGFRNAGIAISAFCLGAFIFHDIPEGGSLLYYKHLSITVGAVLITAVMQYKDITQRIGGIIVKCLSAFNLWIFLLFTVYDKTPLLLPRIGISGGLYNYVIDALAILISLLYAYGIARIKPIADRPLRFVSTGISIYALIGLIFCNAGAGFYRESNLPIGYAVLGTVMLVLVNLLSVFSMRDLLQRLILRRRRGIEWYPIVLSGFFVFLLSQNLTVALDLAFNSVILTVILALTALGWILFGFLRRYQYIRLFGLGLSFVTVIKLFIADLSFLTEGMRIVSYFALGVILLAISFIYQHFSKRLDKKTPIAPPPNPASATETPPIPPPNEQPPPADVPIPPPSEQPPPADVPVPPPSVQPPPADVPIPPPNEQPPPPPEPPL